MTFREQIKTFRDVILGKEKSPARLDSFQKLIARKKKGAFDACKYCGNPFPEWAVKFKSTTRKVREFCGAQCAVRFRHHGPMKRGLAALVLAMSFITFAQLPPPPPAQIVPLLPPRLKTASVTGQAGALPPTTNAVFQLFCTPGVAATVQSSIDLSHWLTVSASTNGSLAYTNDGAPQRYFRLQLPLPLAGLAWNAQTNPVVTGYNIYEGGASRSYTNKIAVNGSSNTNLNLTLLPGATYYFAATTFSSSGAESVYSSEVSYTVPVEPSPKLTITKL